MPDSYLDPEWARSALLTIDLQQDFLDGSPFEIAGTSAIIPNVIRAVEAYRKADLPIVHVVRLYEPGGSDVDLSRRAAVEGGLNFVAPDSNGSQLSAGLIEGEPRLNSGLLLSEKLQQVGPQEWIMFKPRWGAFYRTTLESFLKQRSISTLTVTGCNLPNCPRATLFEASERDFRTALVHDAISQSTPERLADLSAIGVNLISVSDLAKQLQITK